MFHSLLSICLAIICGALCAAVYFSDRVNRWIDNLASAKDHLLSLVRPGATPTTVPRGTLAGGNTLPNGNCAQRQGSAFSSLGNFNTAPTIKVA